MQAGLIPQIRHALRVQSCFRKGCPVHTLCSGRGQAPPPLPSGCDMRKPCPRLATGTASANLWPGKHPVTSDTGTSQGLTSVCALWREVGKHKPVRFALYPAPHTALACTVAAMKSTESLIQQKSTGQNGDCKCLYSKTASIGSADETLRTVLGKAMYITTNGNSQ